MIVMLVVPVLIRRRGLLTLDGRAIRMRAQPFEFVIYAVALIAGIGTVSWLFLVDNRAAASACWILLSLTNLSQAAATWRQAAARQGGVSRYRFGSVPQRAWLPVLWLLMLCFWCAMFALDVSR